MAFLYKVSTFSSLIEFVTFIKNGVLNKVKKMLLKVLCMALIGGLIDYDEKLA